MEGLIDKLHGITDKAVAVGFGVSGPEQVLLQCLLTYYMSAWRLQRSKSH